MAALLIAEHDNSALNGVTAKRSVETILFGDDYAVAGFEQDIASAPMPDIRNVMPIVPDHVPDALFGTAPIDADRTAE